MKNVLFSLSLLILVACQSNNQNQIDTQYTEGWNILSNNDEMAEMVIERAAENGIDHLQLSHSIVMDLKDVKEPGVADKVNKLTSMAHEKGIPEVTVWDHSLYNLSYYPDRFKTGPNGTINLDNPEFWSWVKDDVRGMLNMVPDIDGIILTFIETGAHVEDQYSETLTSEEEKLAAMVDTLASVIIDERDLNLYVRTFIYTRAELGSLLGALNLIQNDKVRVMTKETPHDFFLTHPVSKFVKDIESPVLIEFDAAHEYNGQGIIASIFPEVHVKRWQHYAALQNVMGYVARTDRFNNTSIIHTPSEINLFALHKAITMGDDFNMEQVYDEFIGEMYGKKTIARLKPAFKMASEIIQSGLYTLGLPLSSHSRLDIENGSAYQRHVSGKWLENMYVDIQHDVDTTLHYWEDIVNHLAPAWYKGSNSNQLSVESKWVLDSNWLEPVEKMNEQYLKMISEEKAFGVEKASEALDLVKKAEEIATDQARYDTLLHVFERTLMTARLHEATANAYFGYRVLYQEASGNSDYAADIYQKGMQELPVVIEKILNYAYPGPIGQFDWKEDAYRAMLYFNTLKKLESEDFPAYTSTTFERISYQGFSEEKRKNLLEEYQSFR